MLARFHATSRSAVALTANAAASTTTTTIAATNAAAGTSKLISSALPAQTPSQSQSIPTLRQAKAQSHLHSQYQARWIHSHSAPHHHPAAAAAAAAALRAYNALTRSVAPLLSPDSNSNSHTRNDLTPNTLSWYICGPTVYDEAHLGHASCYVRFDIIRRILTDRAGLRVFQLMGMTDIDDKIIAKAASTNRSHSEVARQFEESFVQDMAVRPPDAISRVTESIPAIQQFITNIIERGFGYTASDGSVYFDTQAFGSRYGKLRPSATADKSSAEATEPADSNKRSPRDFALWKATKSASEPGYPSPFSQGLGRPGWHIECSAIAVFGQHLDIHSGGIDLLFPHHENEIAQCEAHHGVDQWAHHFWHTGHLLINKEKMSKSLNNFVTIKDFLRSYTSNQFRLFCLLTNYRQSVHFDDKTMQGAIALERKLAQFGAVLQTAGATGVAWDSPATRAWGTSEVALRDRILTFEATVDAALCNDFDTSTAMQAAMTLVHHTYLYLDAVQGQQPNKLLVGSVARGIDGLLVLFGCQSLLSSPTTAASGAEAAALASAFADFRAQVRKVAMANPKANKELFQLCDQARAETFPKLGFELQDNKSGWLLSKLAKAQP
ncbi:cysteine-tRNA ligase [Capsaspora owczarzaki ATCC 30864]|uniref:cysteine-tRNA ligase n=1 Tax=Capsaspora owczarzaki (strain ATCC 30864) TaxID=595528 RepID=UPI0003521435|nr:cysteine-tRNA ligase [Capsaspora owczarzaki ATCC 30864]|eukprot:XP_004343149.2 cysteine-tRNA ligase [Capsaspora owczarzaki ATCC 30864]